MSSQIALPRGAPNVNLEFDEDYKSFLTYLGRHLLSVLFNGGCWPICINGSFLKMLCGEELDSGDLFDFDVDAASSNDTSTVIVDGHDGPLATCSQLFRFNYQQLLDGFVRDQVPEEDEAQIWKAQLVQHIEKAMEKNVSIVREALFGSVPYMNELGLR